MLPNAFITLLTSPSYLPGALVLLHSLRELHPAPRDFKTVCLVTPETVDAKTIGELRKAGWDFVIGVEPIGSGAQGAKGLQAMGRPDLNFALTKLHLFRLHTLFSTLIYLDADVLPLRPLAHLFTTTNPHPLSACPDTGWPDCFNSGVMVVRPRQSDWDGMRALLQNGEGDDGIYVEGAAGGNGSFDGADQGLLNEWFSEEGGGGEWNRLPFTYNVTPSAAYTYRPAYQRYGHKINVVHFIGPNKPWANLQNRPAGMSLSKQNSASFEYPALVDRWFDIYDRNVRPTAAHAPDQNNRFAVPEHVAVWNRSKGATQPQDRLDLDQLREAVNKGVSSLKPGQYMSLPLDGRIDLLMPQPNPKSKVRFDTADAATSPTTITSPQQYHAPKPQTLQQQTSKPATWDASRYSPPKEGKPEMQIRMDTRYNPAWEQTPSQQSSYYAHHPPAPEPQYPKLPESVTNDQWYKDYQGRVPDQKNIKPVFPWEQPGGKQRRPDRVFPQGDRPVQYTANSSSTPTLNVQTPTPPAVPQREPSPPIHQRSMVEAMATYKNAWDSMPSIQRYVDGITGKNRRGQAPTGLGIRRESTFDPAAIQSVPPTPRAELSESKANRHRHTDSIDRHSNASGDGDDEDEDDSSESDVRSSPVVPTSEWKRTLAQAPKSSYANNANYTDRDVQTESASMADAKVQAFPGGGPSPAVKTVELSNQSTIKSKPRNVRQNSSSDTPTPRGGVVTPPSDGMSRRAQYAPSGQPSQSQPPSRSFPSSSPNSQSSSFQPTHSARSSYTAQYGNMSHHGGRTPSIDAMTNEGVPVFSSQLGNMGEGSAHGSGGSRYFDPKTDVDVRKRDTQKVLSQFMKVGGFAQQDGLGLK